MLAPARAGLTRLVVCADPRGLRPGLAQAAAPATVDLVGNPSDLGAALARGPVDAVVLVAGGPFDDTAAEVQAIRERAAGCPLVLLQDHVRLIERIELLQLGCDRIITRNIGWAAVMVLVQSVPHATAGATVFLLEDDARLSGQIHEDLTGPLIRVESFGDPDALLAAWQEQRLDLLILGRNAGGVPHWPLLTSIRERERLRALPILMMIDDGDESRRLAFASGADDYLLLPYVREELLVRVNGRLPRDAPPGASAPPAEAASTATGRPRRVLVADDDLVVRRLLERRLLAEGWAVSVAADGAEARRLIELHTFDLMVLDINMPFASGFDLMQMMSERDLKRHARVVVLSALDREEAILRAFALGADDFVAKPFSPEVLVVRLRRLLVG